MRWRWLFFLTAALALTAAGCAWPEPYVYREGEFNREQPNFGKEPADRQSVGICYNKRNATPEQIVELAKIECAKYGKVARFSHQKRLECPISTPMEVVFVCDAQPVSFPWPSSSPPPR